MNDKECKKVIRVKVLEVSFSQPILKIAAPAPKTWIDNAIPVITPSKMI